MSTTTRTPTPGTWAALAARLPITAPDSAREALRRLTAPERHSARVCAAWAAACTAVPPEENGEVRVDLVRTLLLAEAFGGDSGRLGLGDWVRGSISGTTRAVWARGLGAGRRQAVDGPTWTGAIAEAARHDGDIVPITSQTCGDLLGILHAIPGSPSDQAQVARQIWALATVALGVASGVIGAGVLSIEGREALRGMCLVDPDTADGWAIVAGQAAEMAAEVEPC